MAIAREAKKSVSASRVMLVLTTVDVLFHGCAMLLCVVTSPKMRILRLWWIRSATLHFGGISAPRSGHGSRSSLVRGTNVSIFRQHALPANKIKTTMEFLLVRRDCDTRSHGASHAGCGDLTSSGCNNVIKNRTLEAGVRGPCSRPLLQATRLEP